jgi:hypothetical protein
MTVINTICSAQNPPNAQSPALQCGDVKAISYQIKTDDAPFLEEVQYLKSMNVSQIEDDYQLQLQYTTSDYPEYWTFKITPTESDTMLAVTSIAKDVPWGDSEDGLIEYYQYFYDKASGTVNINPDGTLTLTINFDGHTTVRIIWENKAILPALSAH